MATENEISRRIAELMKRDPLCMEFLDRWNAFRANNALPNGVISDSLIPEELKLIITQIQEKWNLSTFRLNDLSFHRDTQIVREHKPAITYHGTKIVWRDVFIEQPQHLYLDINLSTLNIKKDKKRVSRLVWNIIEQRINERDRDKTTKEKRQPHPIGDSPELAVVWHMKDEIFRKHLKRYDLHMNKPKGLPFRTIAAYEIIEQRNPKRLEEGKKRIAERTKRVHTGKGERVLKGVIGDSIKGEDAIEKAIKTIYVAIHRKRYPSKKRMEIYNCVQHGQECPSSCEHLKRWMKDFNKKNWKPTPNPIDIGIMADPRGLPRPAKPRRKFFMK